MDKFQCDFTRESNRRGLQKVLTIVRNQRLLALYFVRRAEKSNGLKKRLLQRWGMKLFSISNIEIGPTDNLGGGLLLIHPYGITINSRSHIGEKFTIFKGATIGSIRSGKKKGTPTIGSRCTVCANAMVCGNIKIGDDVLIAANAYVNFDVPSNSIVIGNPGVIHHKDNPSSDYLKV